MLEAHFQSITIRFEEPGLNWLQTPRCRVSGSLLPTLLVSNSSRVFLCHGVAVTKSRLHWPFSSSEHPLCWPLAATVEGDKGEKSWVAEKKGDIEWAAWFSPEGWTSEACARINVFFNKDKFFHRVNWIYQQICVSHCSICHIHPYTSWYLSLKGFLH